MERRPFRLGLTIGCLGLVVLCCLLPYLVSSLYSIVGTVLGVSAAPTWLWGEWVNRLAGQSDVLYMLLTEGPICAVGTVALVLVILGLGMTLARRGQQGEYGEQSEYGDAVEDELPADEF